MYSLRASAANSLLARGSNIREGSKLRLLDTKYICLKEGRCQHISMMAMCYASDTIEYDRGRPELSNAPLHMKQDTTSTEKYHFESQTTYLLKWSSASLPDP